MKTDTTKLPFNWSNGRLEDLIYIAGRIGWRGLKADEYTLAGPLFFSVHNLNRGDRVSFKGAYHISNKRYEESPEIQLRNDDILLAKDGAGIGKLGIIKELTQKATVNSSLLVVRSLGVFVPEFLFFFLKGPEMQRIVRERISGSATPHLFQRDIKKFELLIPPYAEQLRIAAKIEELFTKLDAGIASLKAAKSKLKRYRQTVLNAAIEGELTRKWREQHQEELEPASVLLERIRCERRAKWVADQVARMKVKVKKLEGNVPNRIELEVAINNEHSTSSLPHKWTWTCMKQIADIGTGATPLRKNTAYYVQGTIPWITSSAVNSIYIDSAEEHITQLAIEETNAKVFPRGTLIVALYGEGKTRGKISELRIDAATNQACAAILFDGVATDLKQYIKIFYRKNYNDIRRLASGGVQPNLNLSIIKETLIPLPPLAEQHQIVAEVERRLSIADEIEATLDAELKRAARLRQSILKRAFEGKLVPQDPNDEPASVLLERIRAERSGQETKPTSRKKKPAPKDEPTLPLE